MNPAKRFRTDSYTVHDVVEMDQDPQSIPEPEPRVYIQTLSFPYTNIYEELYQNQLNYTDFETLEINNIPTIPDAVNLISSDILRQKFYQTSYSIAIRLRIDDKITTLSPLQYEIISTKIDKTRKFLLCLESLSDKKFCFYWKSKDDMPLMTLSLIDLDIVDRESMGRFVNSFLFLELRLENIGLSEEAKFASSTELSLFSLADVNDKNLLMLAAELGNCPVVEDLLKIGFDVNFQVDNQIAADLAWQNRHLDVLLSLLLENSLYPMDFNEANTSNEMKEFVKMTHQFVKSVKNNDETTVQNILDKYPNLRYFYSRDNVSAAFVALSKEKFNIYKIFMNKNVCVGPKEDIDKILTKFNDKKREELRKIHLEHSREPPEKFLMILHSNTSVGHDTINVNEKLNHAKLAIEYLCRISIIRLILQVVAASRDFKLIFDFNRDSVQFLDPTSSKHTRGSFFTSRQIYIAAKFLLDPQHRQEAIGTLAHELCHYAMFLVYKNNCLPYFNGDHKMAKTFHGYLKYCHENRKREKIIGYVFDIPKENQETRHAELVVRVPHLLALYHEDQDYLDKLRELYLPLFSFFEFKVVEDMKTALPNIEIEGDDEIKKFNDKRKRKGFCRMRNLFILIFIASIFVIGITLGVYYVIFFNNDDDLVGEVRQPWNAIIRHSRSDQIMCIGSVIHRDFVLTTAECVHKKHHQNRLPPELFRIEFHPKNDDSFKIYVEDISVHPEWKHNQDNLDFDISLLKLARSLTFSENFHPILLPQQFTELQMTSRNFPQLDYTTIPIPIYYPTIFEVLHTMLGSHSFNIPIIIIDTIECILDDYTINRFLDVRTYCARQMEINYCLNGYGEQLYDDKSNTLHGLVSMGHKSEADCIKNGSLIITDLEYFTDSIKNVICGDVVSSSDSNPWLTRSWIFDFMVAIQEQTSNKFLCWSFLVSPNILITDYNCIKNMKIDEFKLSRVGESMPEIYSIDNKAEVNLAKIILASDSVLSRNVEILNFTSLQNVKIVNNFEDANNISTTYYSYPNEINKRIMSSFCVQYSGGPIFNDDTATIQYFGLITKEPCGEDNCNIEDNGFKVSYVKLYDYIDWINQKPTETTQTPSAPNTTTPVINNTTIPTQTTTTTRFFTLPSFPTFPSLPTVPSFSTPLPDGIQNYINGEIIQQDYCGSTGCSPIRVFSSTVFQINSPLIPYGIASPPDDQINGFESNVLNKNVKSLPIDVVDIFPNLFIFTFTNTGVNRISFDNFRDLRALEVIALNLNEIESIDSDAFNNTAKLRSLILSDNKISIFNEFILQPIQNLEIFNIGSNSLKNNVPIFRQCLMLKEVYLFKNEISEIFNNIFANCDNLEIIDLNSNQISFLHRDLFANKTQLSTVDLTGNVCIDRKFQGSNGTKFTTEEYNSLINATNNCNFLQSTTTTFNPTTPSRPPS